MSDYEHGSMDITDHEKTFDGFISFVVRGTIASVIVLVLIGLLNA